MRNLTLSSAQVSLALALAVSSCVRPTVNPLHVVSTTVSFLFFSLSLSLCVCVCACVCVFVLSFRFLVLLFLLLFRVFHSLTIFVIIMYYTMIHHTVKRLLCTLCVSGGNNGSSDGLVSPTWLLEFLVFGLYNT